MTEQACRGRSGLRIRGERGDPTIKEAYKKFAVWLRKQYRFPIRVPVYLSSENRLVTVSGEVATASFFYPDSEYEEPHIRVSTGDFAELCVELGRNDALAAMLCSLAHEIVHYEQWLKTGTTTERGVAVKARNIVYSYCEAVDEP